MNIAQQLLQGTQKLGLAAARLPVRAEVALAQKLPASVVRALGQTRMNNLGHAFNPGSDAAQEFSQRFPALYNKLVNPHDYRYREHGTEPLAELIYGLSAPTLGGAAYIGNEALRRNSPDYQETQSRQALDALLHALADASSKMDPNIIFEGGEGRPPKNPGSAP